jgi:hypothetical protein
MPLIVPNPGPEIELNFQEQGDEIAVNVRNVGSDISGTRLGWNILSMIRF